MFAFDRRSAARLIHAVCVAIGGAALVPAAFGGEAEDFQNVLAQWAARRNGQLMDAAASGRGVTPAGRKNHVLAALVENPEDVPTTAVPEDDHVDDRRVELLLDPVGPRARHLTARDLFHIGTDSYGFVPRTDVMMWNAESRQIHHPRNGHGFGGAGGGTPDLKNGTTPRRGLGVGYAAYPLMFQAGCFRPDAMNAPFDLGPLPTADTHRPAGYFERDGRRFLIVRTEPKGRSRTYREFWVDPERGAAIRRYALHDDDGMRMKIDVEHERRDDGWRPARWTVVHYNAFEKGEVDLREEYKLDRLRFGRTADAEDFHMKPQVGWWITYDWKGPDGRPVAYVYQGRNVPTLTVAEAREAAEASDAEAP